MALVTLRDLTTNEDIDVPPEGYIFGRVGGDADIQIEDNSISRRQARVSLKGGQWLLETLAVPQGQRAPRPVQLQEGATFTVGQSEFEVVAVQADEEEPYDDPGAKTVAPPRGKPAAAPAPAAKKAPPAPSNAKTAASAPAPKRTATAALEKDSGSAGGDESPVKKFLAMFVAAPKGLAYYLLNVPKMLLNPLGTVRTAIEEQPAEPMGKTELIGYALPSLLVTFLLPAFATGLGLLIGPTHTFSFSSFFPIVQTISAFIGAIVYGWVFHPVTAWVITKLKGESDERSRTNFFLQTMTVSIIIAVPQAVGILLASVAIPFISLLGPLLMVVGSLVTLYVMHQWLVVGFKVVNWVSMVVKVLAVLTLLSTGWGLIQGVRASIAALGSGGSTPSAAVAAAEGEEAEAAPSTELEEMPTDPEEAKAWAKKRQDAALAKAAELQKKAQQQIADATAKAEDAAPKKDAPPEKKPEPVVAAKQPVADPEPVAVKDTPPPPKDEPVVTGSGAYATFARRRDAIEKLFENDPTVLQKSGELQKLYGDYLEAAYDLDKKWGKDTAKNPEHAKLNARLRDAELYGKTGKTIDSLAAKLGVK